MTTGAEGPVETSYPKGRIRVLLLEGVHASAHEIVRAEGFRLETCPGALGEDELVERIREVHVLGIRSKTRVGERALGEARRLLAVGAFCVGTRAPPPASRSGARRSASWATATSAPRSASSPRRSACR